MGTVNVTHERGQQPPNLPHSSVIIRVRLDLAPNEAGHGAVWIWVHAHDTAVHVVAAEHEGEHRRHRILYVAYDRLLVAALGVAQMMVAKALLVVDRQIGIMNLLCATATALAAAAAAAAAAG